MQQSVPATSARPGGLPHRRATACASPRLRPPARRGVALRVAQVERRPAPGPFALLQGFLPDAAAAADRQAVKDRESRRAHLVSGGVESLTTLTDIWERNAELYGDLLAVRDPHHEGSPDMTFRAGSPGCEGYSVGVASLRKLGSWSAQQRMGSSKRAAAGARLAAGQLYESMQDMAAGLQRLGVRQHDKEGNPLSALRFIVLLYGDPTPAHAAALPPRCPLLPYAAVLAEGAAVRAAGGFRPVAVAPGDLATLVYTSGTTGHPKGVMLSHANLSYQVRALSHFLPVQPGEAVLSLLPPWHIYERSCSYFVLSDLGWVAPRGVPGSAAAGQLVLCGRAKDTIVLSSGKNVEPQAVEDAAAASPLVKHVLLLGQDALAGVAEGALPPAQLEARLMEEVARLNAARPDYHPFDHIAHIAVLRTPLSPEDGTLTRTLKPRRPEIMKRYGAAAEGLLKRLRG
ncbi:putative acyl-activating enzyme 16, chloroplastic [Tetrabaena socialis]|uniref:Putative acyl-activating enzyme 16, chloroplastic n=1 Tax=Tetrabaena socialis TaxID=47790 RepID=A0A2J8A0Q6_9CHLO|nr:putative acyl-activating enzyme 16, chloroplastic [Tetrabaena socialis]|eukprot:PNH06111.1 putative acyl-activating enzyme 16, chloroplastic [Tetrabaena socialis]